jgi:hypothetical protein
MRSAALLVMMVTVGVVVVPQAASAAVQGPYVMHPYPTFRDACIGVRGGSTSNSAVIEQQGCLPSAPQNWYFVDAQTTHYYRIQNADGKCMNVQGGSLANSAKVIQYTCGTSISTENDQWVPFYIKSVTYTSGILTYTADYYQLQNLKSGKCLNVQGGSIAAGAALIQYTCNTGINELFTWDHWVNGF